MEDCFLKDYSLTREEALSIIKSIVRTKKNKRKEFVLKNGLKVFAKEIYCCVINGHERKIYPFLDVEGKWGFYYYFVDNVTGEEETGFVYDENVKDVFFDDIYNIDNTNLKLIAEVLKEENKK